jgi:hypothetical protein
MRVKEIISLIKGIQPVSGDELAWWCLEWGLEVKRAGRGGFREVYRIVEADLVVKFPRSSTDNSRLSKYIGHSRVEYQRCYDIKHQYKWYLLRRYVPKIYHYNPDTGVIIMHYYERVGETPKVLRDIKWIKKLLDLVCTHNGLNKDNLNWSDDIEINNIGQDKNGNYKFLDMGFFEVEDDL